MSAFDGAKHDFLKMIEIALEILESLNSVGTWILQ